MLSRLILVPALLLSACTGTEAFGPDKVKHMAAGLVVAAVAEEFDMTQQQACAAVILTGIAKELIDPVFSAADVAATSLYCLTLIDR